MTVRSVILAAGLLTVALAQAVAAQQAILTIETAQVALLEPDGPANSVDITARVTTPNNLQWATAYAEYGETIPVSIAFTCPAGISVAGPDVIEIPVDVAKTGTDSTAEGKAIFSFSATGLASGLRTTRCQAKATVPDSTTMAGTTISHEIPLVADYRAAGCKATSPTYIVEESRPAAVFEVTCDANADTGFTILSEAGATSPSLGGSAYTFIDAIPARVVLYTDGLAGEQLDVRLQPHATADEAKLGEAFVVHLDTPSAGLFAPSPVAPMLMLALAAAALVTRRRAGQ